MKHAMWSLGALAVVLTTVCAGAAEPTKAECFTSNDQAQTLRREGKLRASRRALRVCVSSICPAMVRDDCAQRLDEIERVLPTIVFEARDGAGQDLTTVKVTMDGEAFVEKLDGVALPTDPGEHTFVFEVAGQPAVTKRLVIREGERARHERITIGTPVGPALVAGESPQTHLRMEPLPPGLSSSGSGGSSQRTVGLILGGAGLVGIGIGTAFGLSASSSWSKADKECPSSDNCPSHDLSAADHNSAVTAGTVSTIAFVAGGALVASGLIVFFTAPSGKANTTGRPLGIVPSAGPGGGGLLLRGSF